jgi:SAM-dependent methyltransferase
MNWKLKAKLQNLISLLPSDISYKLYYLIQKKFGGYKNYTPMNRFPAGIKTWKFILDNGYNPVNKTFFEVGTGRVPIIPISFWLMGAKKVVTIDVNPYVEEDLMKKCLIYIKENKSQIVDLFGDLLILDRLDKLIELNNISNLNLSKVLELCNIVYIAPGDASSTGLESKSIDIHTSLTVFEHIPYEILEKIIEEGKRIVKKDGLYIHRIDYSDHFAQNDKSITQINFLQYNQKEWDRYAGNRYMYMNRLRHDDFINLFKSNGHEFIEVQTIENQRSKELLESGRFELDEQFKSKTIDVLSITGSWFLSKCNY